MVTSYNQQGFPEIVTLPAGFATAVKSYDEKGFLVVNSPSPTAQISPTEASPTIASPTALAEGDKSSSVVAAGASSSQKLTKVVSASAKRAAYKAAALEILAAGWLLSILFIF